MYPFIEIFGTKISMTAVGIILALITFIFTAYQLCKKNHQDFYRLFYQLPLRIILAYVLGRYSSFALENSTILIKSRNNLLEILRPKNFEIHYIGLLATTVVGLGTFFGGIKRTENKKIRIDIFFSSICNATIILGIFLTLGDTFIGKATNSIFAIRALHPESVLTKFDGVYPVGLFLSMGALMINVVITILKITLKKNGLGMRGIIGLLIIINICFLYQYYPRYGLINIFGNTLDIKQYSSLVVIILCIITGIRRNKKRFY